MNTPTEENLTDTEVALTNWWCGTDFSAMSHPDGASREGDGIVFTDDAIRGSELLDEFAEETIELLTWFRGYLDASLEEADGTPTVEDFILATHIVMEDNK